MSDPPAPLRVGLVGAGSISRAHLRAFEQYPDIVQLAAVCDVNQEAAGAVAQRFGNLPVYTEIEQLLEQPEIEAVDICTPHDLHARLAVTAAQAGKQILLEKPMATSMADARAILAATERAGVTFMVAQHFRHLPAYVGLKRLLERGTIGNRGRHAPTTGCHRPWRACGPRGGVSTAPAPAAAWS